MARIIGDFASTQGWEARVTVSLHPGTFPVPWAQCAATADFLAAWLCGAAAARGHPVEDLRGTVSYVANELIENAVKFCHGRDVALQAGILGEEVALLVENHLPAGRVADLADKLTELTTGDPVELLVKRVEENAARGAGGGSGLGFLTMMNDYQARLGFSLADGGERGWSVVGTSARLPLGGG
jgi:hypothetical protein